MIPEYKTAQPAMHVIWQLVKLNLEKILLFVYKNPHVIGGRSPIR